MEPAASTDGRALIEESQKALEAVYPEDEIFTLDADELSAPNTQFLVARRGGEAVGCVALVDMVHYGEIKRLFVDSKVRGTGLGRRLMEALEDLAADLGLRTLRLETGPELKQAVALYRSLGYSDRAAFGGYSDLPCSLFMEKRLF